VTSLATAIGRPVAVSPVTEATTLGAAFLAGLAVGTWTGLDDVAAAWRPRVVVEPDPSVERGDVRARWAEAVTRSTGWIPALSALDF
jgi:glycerol kinase